MVRSISSGGHGATRPGLAWTQRRIPRDVACRSKETLYKEWLGTCQQRAELGSVRTNLSFVSSVLYVHSGSDSADTSDAACVWLREAHTEDGEKRLPPDNDQHRLGRTTDAPTEVIVARDLPSLISHARSGSPHADRHTT
jgi:hypothetical protein